MLQFFSLNKPAPDVVARQGCVSLKKQVALFALNADGVSVTLSACLHGSSLSDIQYAVDGIVPSILPCDLSWEHDAVFIEVGFHSHIYFVGFLNGILARKKLYTM